MIKAIALIKRKPGISREEFIEHYEQVHAPLALKYFHTFRKYVRNYVLDSPDAQEVGFDCITEVWYDDMEGYQEVIDFMGSEDGRVIRDDEEKFIDNSRRISFFVQESSSELGKY